ncbi:MAG: hypothetical protein AB8G96_00400 [Phycisphaerales bacterium]
MSKLRDAFESDFTVGEGDFDAAPESDPRGFVVFTQLREGVPFRYAGWLRAGDNDHAMYLAREHYGRDQEVGEIIAIDERTLGGTDLPWEVPTGDEGDARPFAVFTQAKPGDVYLSASPVSATSLVTALAAARTAHESDAPSAVWVVDDALVLRREPDEMLWRHLDQTYRLARGYTPIVKEKWKQFRDEDALREYQKSDLKKEF